LHYYPRQELTLFTLWKFKVKISNLIKNSATKYIHRKKKSGFLLLCLIE